MLTIIWLHFRQLREKLSTYSKDKLNAKIAHIRQYIPVEFNRKLRPLSDLAYGKASEYRLFMLYVGYIVLKDSTILSSKQYRHFLKLCAAMRYLIQQNTTFEELQTSHRLLIEFVQGSISLYAENFGSYNVHSLKHLVDYYWIYGSLENINAFAFESYLGILKNCI